MIFLGMFLSGDEMSIPCTATDGTDITYVQLENGKYDNLYITKKVSDSLTPDFPEGWDFDTILYAKFNGNAHAGNVDWSVETVSHMLIKRRRIEDFTWHVLAVKAIHDKTDFVLQGTDYTNAAKTYYEYAVVPSFYGIEGNYDAMKVYSDFEDIFLVSQNGMVHTCLTDGYCDMSRNTPSTILQTIHSKYPSRIRNSAASYDTGTFNGSFLAYSPIEREYITEDKSRTDYQSNIIEFLSDGMPKLLKHFDSRLKLISIDESVSNNANGHYQNRDFSFQFTEIGNSDSEKDLYESGLSNVSEEWWQIL